MTVTAKDGDVVVVFVAEAVIGAMVGVEDNLVVGAVANLAAIAGAALSGVGA